MRATLLKIVTTVFTIVSICLIPFFTIFSLVTLFLLSFPLSFFHRLWASRHFSSLVDPLYTWLWSIAQELTASKEHFSPPKSLVKLVFWILTAWLKDGLNSLGRRASEAGERRRFSQSAARPTPPPSPTTSSYHAPGPGYTPGHAPGHASTEPRYRKSSVTPPNPTTSTASTQQRPTSVRWEGQEWVRRRTTWNGEPNKTTSPIRPSFSHQQRKCY